MSEKLTQPGLDITHASGASIVRVSGVIDERFQPASFAALSERASPVLIDLDGASRITSFGVREWMRALKDLRTDQYFYVRVRPAMVAQFNSVNQFGGRGRIVSLYCPYVCPACENTFDVLVDLRKKPEFVRAAAAPSMECPFCKALGDFDDIEATYFAYVASAPPLQVPAAIEAIIDGKKQPLQLHKAVEGDLTILWLKGAIDKSARLKRHADGLEGKVLVVLEGAEIVTAEGLTSLSDLAQSPSADVFLARVPLAIIKSFAADAAGNAQRNILSCVIHTHCSACGHDGNVEVNRADFAPAADANVCDNCSKPARAVPWTAEDAAVIAALQFATPPPEIDSYMREHADWQTHKSVAGREEPRGDVRPKVVEAGVRIDKYEVIRRIGFGGMADVLLGRQIGVEGFEKKVVIKRILPHLARQANFVKMFLEEARVAARLLHGNIVQVYDLLHEGDEYYAILEFVRGADLNVLLRVSSQLRIDVPIEIACRIVSDVCAGLHAAHSYCDDTGAHKPIVHRDVSPHNVLLSTEGAVKLTDFGIAKAADSLVDDTGTGVLKGKVMYMPPEAILGEGADHRADVYAAAVVLYQCLAGKNPFNRGSQGPSMRAVLDEAVPGVDTVRKDAPPALAAIIARGMQRDAAVRYQTAAALAADLEDFLVSFAKPASAARVGAWAKDLIARGRDLSMAVPQNTPSNAGILDGDATSVTAPGRVEPPPDRSLDDWFDGQDLKR